jgi:hypothetical protein
MLDSELAELYGVETKALNRAVKRHIARFPDDFLLHLTRKEVINLRYQIGTSSLSYGGRRYRPYAFTEQGVAMLSSVLNSERAVQVVPFFAASSCCDRSRPVGARLRSPLRWRSVPDPQHLPALPAEEARHLSLQEFMFPDPKHVPAHSPQHAVDEPVPRPVRRDLLSPERRISPRLNEMPRPPVPETARLAVASCEGGLLKNVQTFPGKREAGVLTIKLALPALVLVLPVLL